MGRPWATPWQMFRNFHHFMREAQASYRIKRGKKPTEMPWEGERAMKKIVAFLVKLPFLQGYRRQIGIGVVLAAGVIKVISGPDVIGAIPWLTDHASAIAAIGAWVALIGAAYKDDPKPEAAKIQ